MEHKNIVATIYLKNGQAVKSMDDFTPLEDVIELARLYNDNGIDKIIIFDLSDDDEEHEKNIHTIKNINRNVEIKVCAGGNINRLEDIKKFIYAGCIQVIVNGAKQGSMEIAEEASKRFGKDRILVSVENVDFIFKHQDEMRENFHELLVLNTNVLDAIENITDVPYVVNFDTCDYEKIIEVLKRKNTRGIAGNFINDPQTDIMEIKSQLSAAGIKMDNFEPALKWMDFKKNSDGMVPVVVQDYRTDEVLMLAYMNEEAFDTTVNTGRMTYFSRSRNELWTKGMTSGHIQYVKSLTADCDFDTILAKVSQVGVACHTGNPTCFFNEIVKKEYVEKNPLKVLEDVYGIILDRKANPKEGSYTNYLFDKGIDKILKKVGEEATEIVIAAKNPEPEEIKYEISDFLYHMMVLMAEKGVTWEDITQELSQR
ncbi:MAG: bifunctional phosphoribosyl-AMP cyclohydrolase/phosphoribosyl-ATP diphosphatase HisIE [Clostridiales bacterium]|nr:bifunctional phosphoribosyl-AMP cyclohydrolase/phosphoribosyl-ATP diphosphatase HisIE [Roseburia sp.]MDD7635963.1 bifunctional phosphoribosyl-AMP cyclohydrolase/phosphoribosyl-ATP diphosphatase HisIE [Clostridiales bacterium]MDY4111747.1 bifunctional phosphoribosyl-AMP cyclohydrolase/phosphoribosyl-ATP diphosphatase HisIE [Roseburia sp.]